MTDYYAVLGIGRTAEADAIAKAYRRSALTYNPECNVDHPDQAELARRFRLVSTAYYVLSNAQLRAIYDVYGEDGVRHGGTGKIGVPGGVAIDKIDPDTVFRQFFGVDSPFQVLGDITGSRSGQHNFYSEDAAKNKNPPKAPQEIVHLAVTLEEVFEGALRRVTWSNPHRSVAGDIVSETQKSIEFTLPRGVNDREVLTIEGVGGTKDECSTGDLLIHVSIQPHEHFKREGDNLIVTIPITLADALSGVTCTVHTLDKRTLPISLDEVVHPAFERVIKNEGMVVRGDHSRRGDLIVRCNVEFPKYLTAAQKSEIRRILQQS